MHLPLVGCFGLNLFCVLFYFENKVDKNVVIQLFILLRKYYIHKAKWSDLNCCNSFKCYGTTTTTV